MRIVLLTTDNREPHKDYDNPQPHFGTAPSALLQGLAMVPEIEVHVVSCIRRMVRSPEGIAPNTFFHSLVVPKLGWMKTLFQGCIRSTRNKIHQIRPDIVHGQGTEADCSISAIFSGYPNVITLHGNMRSVARINRDRPFSYNWIAARLEQFVLPRTGGVICISNYTRRAVADITPRTWLVPNAVDKSFFELQASGLNVTSPIGLCVGTVCGYKNQNSLIQALDPLAMTKDFKLRFLGQAGTDAYGREFTRLVNGRKWCEHLGFVSRSEIGDQLKTASFLILPTREDNCPMVVLEAMAAGVPVLASRIGGIPDLIESGKNGLLFDPGESLAIRAAVEKAISDRSWATAMAAEAKHEALRLYHPMEIARRHLQVYREFLANSHRRE